MLSQYGVPVRGLSPYADALRAALERRRDIRLEAVDYRSPFPAALHPAGSSPVSVPGELHWARPRTWWHLARRTGDILHIQHWQQAMAIYLYPLVRLARYFGKKVIITVHNPRPHEGLFVFAWAERLLLTAADGLIVHDQRGYEILRHRIDHRLIRVIPHGVDAVAERSVTEADYSMTGLAPARRYVLVFGNLRRYKGIVRLLAAWSEIIKELPDVDLVIAGRLWSGNAGFLASIVARILGSAGEAERLRTALTEPKLAARVHMREGFQSDEALDALLRVAEFSVFPYERFHSQSGAACRAAAAGCPVLVSEAGGLPMLAIDNDWIVPAGDTSALIDGIRRRLKEGCDRQVATRWRRQQINAVKRFAWTEVARMHSEFYADLLDAGVAK